MGDQATNVEPWRLAIEQPEWSENLNIEKLNKKPKTNVKLDFVFGYRTRDTRNNLRYISENKILYHSGSYGLIHDLTTNKQKIFSQHNFDIISMCLNNSKTLIASGEDSSRTDSEINPSICIWDTDSKLISKIEGNFEKGINSLNFSPDSSKLLAVSLNEEHTIYLFDLKENRLTATSMGGSTKILDCCFKSEKEFSTVGIKHFKYWMISENNLVSKEGFFGQADNKLGLVICHEGNFVTGSATGELTIWRDEVISANKKCHLKNIDSLYSKDE